MFENYTEAELNRLITDGVEEHIHLDYKAADALAKTDGKKKEIAKDISAFANSDGGTIIYGIREYDDPEHRFLPEKIDPIDRQVISKEWLEQVINSNIRPKVPGIIINPIPLASSEHHVVYVVSIPRSTVPHQAADLRYYKRYNFESLAMHDYEINDVRNRQLVEPSMLDIDLEIKPTHMVYIIVRNVGKVAAVDVTFDFPDNVLWLRKNAGKPSLFIHGIRKFPPGKTFRYIWNMAPALFAAKDPAVLQIEASATYLNPQNGLRQTDTFHLDLEAYRFNSTLKSDTEQLKDAMREDFRKLTLEVQKLRVQTELLSPIANGTGLNLSVRAWENLRALQNGNEFQKLDPRDCMSGVFKEVLNVDWDIANQLEMHFRHDTPPSLDNIEGLTDDIRKRISAIFRISEAHPDGG